MKKMQFVAYVQRFYGPGGLYDMGASKAQISAATSIYLAKTGTDYCGDSLDRESVRDIMIQNFNLKFPS